jgi:hypothetical protein
VYSASTSNHQYTGDASFTPFEIGNQVALAGSNRHLNSIGIVVTPQNQDVVADFKFRFYANDGPGGVPGTLLGESATFEDVHLSGQYHGVGTGVFLSDIVLPDVLTWTVEITNATPVPVGLPHVVPPAAVGQNLAAWHGSSSIGWGRLNDAPLFDAYIFATPEPSSIHLMVVTGLLWLTKRSKRRPRV